MSAGVTDRPIGPRLAFPLVVVLVHALLLLPIAIWSRFDLSVFVTAGDRFVDAARVAAPIRITPHSTGYDGQFYYRFALDPFSLDRAADGITLDSAAKRMERIFYPLLAWVGAMGHARLVPASLVVVNLAGLGAIAACAAWLARRLALPCLFALGIVAWPGFVTALTHDTAEIVAAALLLGALCLALSGRPVAFCIAAIAAALTRETVLPMVLGLFLAEAQAALTTGRPRWRLLALHAAPMAVFVVWHTALGLIWREWPLSGPAADALAWPLAGVIDILRVNASGARVWTPDPMWNGVMRMFALVTIGGLVVFGGVVAASARRLWPRTEARGLVFGWLLTAGLMACLRLVEPVGYLRAFSEYWVVGCLLIALAPPGRALARPLTAAAAVLAATVLPFWYLCCAAAAQ
jgi:hypothetical protein